MWFKQEKFAAADNNEQCQSLLSSLQTDGISVDIAELLQYQSKSHLIDLSARKNIHGKQSGNYLSRSKGRGMEFDEVRHYQTGDDIRAIDWRVTARTGKTHTKLFREEIERPVLVATDLSNNMHFGSQLLFKSVQACHIAALVGWHAKSRGDRLGGIVFNQHSHVELKPRSRKEGVLHYLHALTSIHKTAHANEEQNDNSFEQNCARLRQLAKPGSLIYFITDAHQLNSTDQHQQNILSHLSQISQHCELVICLVHDPMELSLPQSDLKMSVNLTDGYNRQTLTLGDKDTADKYQRQANASFKLKQYLLSKSGARVIEFSAGETLEAQLKQGMKN